MNIVTTMMIGDAPYAKHTIPPMIAYAERIGAQFRCINNFTDHAKIGTQSTLAVYYEKFRIFEDLQDGNRVMFFDADVLIKNPKTYPNFFDHIPEPLFGTRLVGNISGDVGKEYIAYLQQNIGTNFPFYLPNYWCFGFLLVSPRHAKTFDLRREEYKKILAFQRQGEDIAAAMPDQNAANLVSQMDGTYFYDIAPKYHFIPWRAPEIAARACELERNWANRKQAEAVHYAGPDFKRDMFKDVENAAGMV